jgi:hypothetical protein
VVARPEPIEEKVETPAPVPFEPVAKTEAPH